ncbi:MAG: TlyA family RNA methyltransferase [Bacillota bacterium]|nr:TlyA family RNA methyltransferase [Bacillota bacterium]MDD3298690.1 TlyA family RNA methyltransferase [Bacillota bacterium]MDD3850537.1 TlyA family RNA methyltransferase [Bacillota bacterium]MDD4707667.1 TlyA family RNA methyltransferase [Bacillota bacterium]
MASKKKRLDTLLVDRGLFQSRERAKALIMAGLVKANGKIVDKAGTKVCEDADLSVAKDPIPYVSRGGIKLERALDFFNIVVSGSKAIDIGSSTGGFTDCLLKRGAKKVYSIDVGYGQLDWKLRQDPRVVVMERTNIRYVKPEDIGEACDIAVIDVAFISLNLVLPVARSLLKPEGTIIALIKPQFEAGREKVGKKGVVRDPLVHGEVVRKIYDFIISMGYQVRGITHSPITGAGGNIEYLIYASGQKCPGCCGEDINRMIEGVIEESHCIFS